MIKRGIFRFGGALFVLTLLWIAFAAAGYAASADAVWPECPGTVTQTNGKMLMDASHMDQGYVMVCVNQPTSHKMKLRITYGGGQLMYDINSDGMFEAFPLQLGSGNYKFEMFENVSGNKFSAEGQIALSVQLKDENAAFLVPNQYVNYDMFTAAVLKSDEICTNPEQTAVYKSVTNFIASEFAYDFVRAKTISSGTLPDIDYCYSNRMGICQDLAAVTCCMLRVQGVPARLMIGYADKYYHAWITANVAGQDVFFDPTNAVGAINARQYKTERYY